MSSEQSQPDDDLTDEQIDLLLYENEEKMSAT